MSFSTPQVESRIQFSPLEQDVEQVHFDINDRHMVLEPCEEQFDWDALLLLLRLALVLTLFLGLALQPSKKPKLDHIPPKFFLNSLNVPHLNVSEGEVSSTWDVTLAISNVMNNFNINILNLEAKLCYKENETLAMITPIKPQDLSQREVFMLDEKETKKVHFKLSTTGWEQNQPIVDDTVVQAIAHDVQLGVTRFSLHMRVVGEALFGDGWVEAFIMYPKCNNLEEKFVGANQQGEVATMIDHRPQECVGLVEWGSLIESR